MLPRSCGRYFEEPPVSDESKGRGLIAIVHIGKLRYEFWVCKWVIEGPIEAVSGISHSDDMVVFDDTFRRPAIQTRRTSHAGFVVIVIGRPLRIIHWLAPCGNGKANGV